VLAVSPAAALLIFCWWPLPTLSKRLAVLLTARRLVVSAVALMPQIDAPLPGLAVSSAHAVPLWA
jgi:hypothetical protein